MGKRSRLIVVVCVLSLSAFLGGIAPASAAASSTSSSGAAASSTLGDVVFVKSGDLYLASRTDGTVRRLTWGGGRGDPAFSPNGSTIAYDRAGDIWLLTVGGSTRRLTFNGLAGDPAWSAGGRTLAYTQVVAGGHSDIFQIPAAGGTPVRVTWAARSGCDASQPSWQPTSGWVVYVRSNPGSGACTAGIVRRQLGSAARLTVADPYAGQPVFTSDGRHLAYLAPCDPQVCIDTGVWLASSTGTARHTTEPLTGWTCAEGDMCVQAIAESPFGGWAQEGTWSDPDTGQAVTCFQGVEENPDGSVSETAPSQCVSGIVGSFSVRPA